MRAILGEGDFFEVFRRLLGLRPSLRNVVRASRGLAVFAFLILEPLRVQVAVARAPCLSGRICGILAQGKTGHIRRQRDRPHPFCA
jgi:hypothetical protein